jgi:hypothetical protein
MAKLKSEKQKKLCVYEEKVWLIGSIPGLDPTISDINEFKVSHYYGQICFIRLDLRQK